MNFKSLMGGGGSGGDSSTSFAAARALFEAAKKPENRALAAAAAKNPVIRNAAISAAQNPQTRQAMVSAASTYTANQNNAPSSSVLKPEPAPRPPSKDYGSSSSTSYGSSIPARPAPSIGAPAKPVYPDLMSELKALNIGRDNEPASSYSAAPRPAYHPAPAPPQQAYHPAPAPPQPAYHPAPPLSQPAYHPAPAPPQPAYHPAPALLQPAYHPAPAPPQPAYHPAPAPPQPAYHPAPAVPLPGFHPAPAAAPPQPAVQRQDWTKFSDAPARPPPPKNMPLSPKSTSPTTEAYAVVKFPHAGSHFDELACVAGDRIVLKREVDDQWIYGFNQRTGKFGIVPIAFLDVKVPLAPAPTAQKKSTVAAPMSPTAHMGTALYDYFSQEPGDLTFSSGASIRILERVGADWLSGEIHGRQGIFPAAFVDCRTLAAVPLQAPATTAAAGYGSSSGGGGYGSGQGGTVTATYDYNSGVDGDLVFFTGDVIDVVERLPDGEWLRGRCRGHMGLVPMTYVSATAATSPAKAFPSSSASSHSLSSPTAAAAAPSRFPPGTPCNPPVTVIAVADYHTGEADCLYFSRGDHILVTEYVDNEWAKGKPAEFKTLPAGYFPRSYVQ